MDSSDPKSTAPELPVMHTAVRPAPGTGSALKPSDSMRSQTARTCSSVACDCITTSMNAPCGKANLRVYCKREAGCKSRARNSCLENVRPKQDKEPDHARYRAHRVKACPFREQRFQWLRVELIVFVEK